MAIQFLKQYLKSCIGTFSNISEEVKRKYQPTRRQHNTKHFAFQNETQRENLFYFRKNIVDLCQGHYMLGVPKEEQKEEGNHEVTAEIKVNSK